MPLHKISADEARSRVKGPVHKHAKGDMIAKATKGGVPSWDAEKRSAIFVMSSERTDRYGDIVATEGIQTEEFSQNPVGLLFHSARQWPVGTWDNLAKMTNTRPKRLEGMLKLLPAGGPVKEIDEAAWMLENNGIRACSIGFVPNWDEIESIRGEDGEWLGLRFNESELVECSVCCVPANPDALAKDAGGAPTLAKEFLEDVLDNWARTPEGLILPRAEYEARYFLRDSVAQTRSFFTVEKEPGLFRLEEDGVANGYKKWKRVRLSAEDVQKLATPEPAPVVPAIEIGDDTSKIEKSVIKRLLKLFGVEKSEPEAPAKILPPPLSKEQRDAIEARAAAQTTKLKEFA